MSMFCPAMIPMTCGWYMQPVWFSSTVEVGICQVWSGRPALTHTNAYFTVPLSLITTSSDFCGAALWAFMQVGFADMSMVFATGLVQIGRAEEHTSELQ